MELVVKGEDLILPNPDPAVEIKRGYRRFLVGLDIAQAQDRNAASIILDERVPFYDASGRQELGKRRREIVRAMHLPQMSYSDLASVVRNLMLDPSIVGRAYLAVDAGGVDRNSYVRFKHCGRTYIFMEGRWWTAPDL